MTASHVAHRKANNSNKGFTSIAIQCVHTDSATGFNEYFVVSSGKKRGCWHSEKSVDVSSLIQYRFERRRPYVEKKDRERNKKLERERKAKMEQMERERNMKTEQLRRERNMKMILEHERKVKKEQMQRERKARKDHLDLERKAKKEQLERERQMLKASNAPKAPKAPNAHNGSIKRKAPASAVKSKPSAKKPKDFNMIKQKELDFQTAVNTHRDDTFVLLKESAARGESSVPSEKMTGKRTRNLAVMKMANLQVHQAGGKKLSEKELGMCMSNAESAAVQLYVKEMHKKKKLANRTSSPAKKPAQQKQAAGRLVDAGRENIATKFPSQGYKASAGASLQPLSVQPAQLVNQPLSSTTTNNIKSIQNPVQNNQPPVTTTYARHAGICQSASHQPPQSDVQSLQ